MFDLDIDYKILKNIVPLEGNIITASYRDMPVEGGLIKSIRACEGMDLARHGFVTCIDGPSKLCDGDYWCGFEAEPSFKEMERHVDVLHVYKSLDVAKKVEGLRPPLPYNLAKYLILAPLEKTNFKPDLVIIICLPAQACNLLSTSCYDNGDLRTGVIHTALCRSAITDPLLDGDIHIGLGDRGGRRWGNFKPEEMIVSMPLKWFLTILRNYDEIKRFTLQSQS